ncbi:MAG: putative signal transducing protein [Bacteroidales bacterium]
MENELSPHEVFDGTGWEAGLLKSILDDNEIESFIRDASFVPLNLISVRAGSVKVYVAFKDFERAQLLVKEFYKNMK